MYFSAVTAEEQGLLGSQYLGEHPPVPAKDISLDLNYDMLLPIGVPLSADLGGAERIDFWPTIKAVAKEFHLDCCRIPILQLATTIAPITSRWRAPAFLPSLSIRVCFLKSHDEAWGRAQFGDFEEHHYHQPSDEYHADWDFRGNAKFARFGFVLGWLASEQSHPVEWQSGDEFEAGAEGKREEQRLVNSGQ